MITFGFCNFYKDVRLGFYRKDSYTDFCNCLYLCFYTRYRYQAYRLFNLSILKVVILNRLLNVIKYKFYFMIHHQFLTQICLLIHLSLSVPIPIDVYLNFIILSLNTFLILFSSYFTNQCVSDPFVYDLPSSPLETNLLNYKKQTLDGENLKRVTFLKQNYSLFNLKISLFHFSL